MYKALCFGCHAQYMLPCFTGAVKRGNLSIELYKGLYLMYKALCFGCQTQYLLPCFAGAEKRGKLSILVYKAL